MNARGAPIDRPKSRLCLSGFRGQRPAIGNWTGIGCPKVGNSRIWWVVYPKVVPSSFGSKTGGKTNSRQIPWKPRNATQTIIPGSESMEMIAWKPRNAPPNNDPRGRNQWK